MNPLSAYRRQQAVPAWTRIDLLLALYQGAIERAEKALELVSGGDPNEERRLRARARMIVAGLASAVDPSGELSDNFLRLYQFAMSKLEAGGSENLRAALGVLRTLREGFEQIRPEAIDLERSGVIPSAEAVSALHLLA